MGWYLRKALKFGPLRINLSKSGLGGSVGVKGLRVGTGPRGRYLHAGREGLYFRQSIGSSRTRTEDGSEGLVEDAPDTTDAATKIGAAAGGSLARFLRGILGGLTRGR
jgi:hypothetical protein